MNLAASFRAVFDRMEVGEFFHGWELRNSVVLEHYKQTGEKSEPYVDTILRYLRKSYPSRYELVDRHDSLYRKI